ncbi:segregation/condensation protein A [Alphaproteobacteria bacterium]|nr:segregation/condensation protein A [Alphaproteobacteria bacterium]
MSDTPSDSVGSDDFDEGVGYQPVSGDGLALNLEGYEGPLDILLSLARTQKVDLKQISILQLAEQYLDFVRDAQDLKLEVAADYLVMASWLAYLKSRLLLPKLQDDGEVSAEELAARLVYRLQVLEAMRDGAAQLMARDLMGRDFFAHGMPEGIRIKRESKYHASLYEVLAAYSTQRLRNYYEEWTPPKLDVLTIDRARMRLERLLGKLDDWEVMVGVISSDIRDPQKRRTTIASSFSAVLEYVRDGRLEAQQSKNFDEVLIRRARPKAASETAEDGANNE